jgi:hypothetical protein
MTSSYVVVMTQMIAALDSGVWPLKSVSATTGLLKKSTRFTLRARESASFPGVDIVLVMGERRKG